MGFTSGPLPPTETLKNSEWLKKLYEFEKAWTEKRKRSWWRRVRDYVFGPKISIHEHVSILTSSPFKAASDLNALSKQFEKLSEMSGRVIGKFYRATKGCE